MGRTATAAWGAAGLAVCVGYQFLTAGTPSAAVVYDSLALVAVVLLGLRAVRDRADRAGWLLLAAGAAARFSGDVTYEIYRQVLHQAPSPSPADAFYLAAYPLIVAGALRLAHRRLRLDRAGYLDAAVIAGGLGLVWWLFAIEPLTDGAAMSVRQALAIAYPAADILMVALAARLLIGAGARRTAVTVFVAGLGTLIASDVASAFLWDHGVPEGVIALGWMLTNVLWGTAAMVSPTDAGDDRVTSSPPYGRVAILVACALLIPVMIFVHGERAEHDEWFDIGIAAAGLVLVVAFRMAGFVVRLRRQATEMETLALRDELTGLANRRQFEHRLAEAVATGNPQVAHLDLAGFKAVNDRLGHAVGDQLLAAVAERFAASLRGSDMVARMGGDEFAVLLPDASDEVGDAVAVRLESALRAPIRVAGKELLVSAYIGVASAAGATDPGELLRRADVAMYAAKVAGRHWLRYTADLDDRADESAQLGADIRRGLDTGQFKLVYQPIVTLPEGRTVAVETLVRWVHPKRGLVSPADFIPVAEENGLIVELGEWIMRAACRQAVWWKDTLGDRAPLYVAVNVSARQLAEPDFARTVASILAWSGMPASMLTVEITETAVFAGGQAVETVKALRELGVKIALDDFGTGHSSLGLLRTLPIDALKVDKQFVDTVTMAGQYSVIAQALIQVADGLELVAVAEGVETAEQAAELHRIGYRFAQGFHFGRPVDDPFKADTEALLHR
jgi:diguanylate cyclase (GGDEF)-like protein